MLSWRHSISGESESFVYSEPLWIVIQVTDPAVSSASMITSPVDADAVPFGLSHSQTQSSTDMVRHDQ